MKCTRFIAMKYYKLIMKLMIKLKTVNYFYICSAKQKIDNKKFYLFHQNKKSLQNLESSAFTRDWKTK